MGALLHQLLTESAERTPDAVAVRYGDETLSYGELESRSNRLSRVLVEEGAGVGDPVVLHLGKSQDAIVALLAILKSGACCAPIDSGTPPARLRRILDQCSARLLIGSAETRARLSSEVLAGSSLECVLVVGGGEVSGDLRTLDATAAAAGQNSEPVGRKLTERDLAYVLFTSGSTGTPKGVMLSHLNVRSFVEWAVDTFAVGPGDHLSNHAPLNFDLSTFDIFGALAAGASVTVVPERLSMFPVRLADLIERDRITVWYSVPSVLTLLATHGNLCAHDLSSLRLVLFAGEVFPVKHLRELMRALAGPRYFNLYGPTETNVCTYYEVERPPALDSPPIAIGKACAGATVVALAEDGSPVDGPGKEGVLHVGGPTVMAGYYGRPEETEAAFVDDPSGADEGERLYCTGDWVTIDEDGNYLFLGRRDDMVKSGGHRIELGEVEAALYAHAGVREAVAVAVPDDLLGNRIKAVVVPVEDRRLDERELRRHCGARLPRYMVPSEVEFRSTLPRTPTEKVDRALLASPCSKGSWTRRTC
jgi:amino acid adenylation domain-containing protein